MIRRWNDGLRCGKYGMRKSAVFEGGAFVKDTLEEYYKKRP